jgi:hypothetical protein
MRKNQTPATELTVAGAGKGSLEQHSFPTPNRTSAQSAITYRQWKVDRSLLEEVTHG